MQPGEGSYIFPRMITTFPSVAYVDFKNLRALFGGHIFSIRKKVIHIKIKKVKYNLYNAKFQLKMCLSISIIVVSLKRLRSNNNTVAMKPFRFQMVL